MPDTETTFLRTQFIKISLLLFVAIASGTLGFMLIEAWAPLDALYMTVITLGTVGYREIEPLSKTGKIFTMLLIGGGVGIVAYASTTMVRLLVSADIQTSWQTRRRRTMLKQLDNHDIVCGFGRMGQHVVAELVEQKRPFVIIDKNEDVVEQCRQNGYLVLEGDASNEDILHEAGIERARGLYSVVNSDAANVFIILTARALRPELVIVARVNYDDAEPKLRRAGANQVISPYAIGGRRMVSYLDRPGVVDFLDVVMHSAGLELQMEEFIINANSPWVGKSLAEIRIRSEIGVNILSVRVPGKPGTPDPDINQPLQAGTQLIGLGTPEQLTAMEKFAAPRRPKHISRRA